MRRTTTVLDVLRNSQKAMLAKGEPDADATNADGRVGSGSEKGSEKGSGEGPDRGPDGSPEGRSPADKRGAGKRPRRMRRERRQPLARNEPLGKRMGKYLTEQVSVPRLVVVVAALVCVVVFVAGYGVGTVLAKRVASDPVTDGGRRGVEGPTIRDPGNHGVSAVVAKLPTGKAATGSIRDEDIVPAARTPQRRAAEPKRFFRIVQLLNTDRNKNRAYALVAHIKQHALYAKVFCVTPSKSHIGVYVRIPDGEEPDEIRRQLYTLPKPPGKLVVFDFKSLRNETLRVLTLRN